jgi:hypothetical protein
MKFGERQDKKRDLVAARAASNALRNRLIFLSVLLAAVVVALVMAGNQQREIEQRAEDQVPAGEQPASERVVLPPFDVESFARLVSDATPQDRVLTDADATQRLVDHARVLAPAHLRELGVRELDGGALAAIRADPAAFRAAPFRVRGYIDSIDTRPRKGRTEHYGVLQLEGGELAHFIALDVPEHAAIGGFIRLDGLFLKLASIEGDAGWVEAPLFVAPRAVRSWPAIAGGGAPESFPADLLATVVDDDLRQIAPEPFEAKWALAAWVRDLEPGTIDWSTAPELDNDRMSELLEDGSRFRGRPLRIRVARNQGTWIEDAGENPARIERITSGWLGSWEWTNKAGVLQYLIPRPRPELLPASDVSALGFFLRNQAYEARDGGLRIAPVFVFASVEPFAAPAHDNLNAILYGIGALTLFLAAAFWFFLMRDRGRSRELQAELVRRRRARRGRVGPPATSAVDE